MVFGALFRSNTKKRCYDSNRSPKNLSIIDRVKYLEQRGQRKGYKEKWLYHRCKEENLLNEYFLLYPQATNPSNKNKTTKIDTVLFSFGKYRGESIEEVWKKDKQYIEWLSNQDWILDYEIESFTILRLIESDRSLED
ncbi:hypothetical protein [Ulvibacterium marinum]|uniref:exodeoxyribonuclease X C-terminal domain-containing protein n=1 Tax=Ulvibacterium marinum TaxID=2419782 RepID=UPI00249502B6|nr:hypothetical protein [Ulvibacterium marinum]